MIYAALIFSLIIILIGAEIFTNGVEWLGKKLQLSEGAVGSILAAVGTALPETMIPVIAILFGAGEEAAHIGIGAILGAPFMLFTPLGKVNIKYRKYRQKFYIRQSFCLTLPIPAWYNIATEGSSINHNSDSTALCPLF